MLFKDVSIYKKVWRLFSLTDMLLWIAYLLFIEQHTYTVHKLNSTNIVYKLSRDQYEVAEKDMLSIKGFVTWVICVVTMRIFKVA